MKRQTRISGDHARRGFAARISFMALHALVALGFCAVTLQAQQVATAGARGLSLEDALRMAEAASEQVAIARAGVMRSQGQLRQAKSEYFPQISGSLSYTRTLASEFSAFSSSTQDSTTTSGPACGSFIPNPALSLNERVDSLEAALRCQSEANPFSAFRNLPFGRENVWNLGLSASQTLFSGGRVQAQTRIASAGRSVADLQLTSARAQLMLNVASAYYNAALADQLLQISQASLAQADTTLVHVKLARQLGEQPEFELLRAQVSRDTQEPLVIQRRSDRDLAVLRLKQLLNLPSAAPVELTTALDGSDMGAVVQLASNVVGVELDTATALRSPVRQAEQAVRIQQAQMTIARAQRLPSVALNMQYGRVGYPQQVSPFSADFRTNWTVGASIQVPLFTGGRISGDALVARANLDESKARLQMTRELATLDNQDAVQHLAAAQAAWNASSGTVEQANRAYSIAEVRYTEGISTQLELTDSRILLQQAEANRAQAARDLQLARLRLALLPALPISTGSTSNITVPGPSVTNQQQAAPAQGTAGGIQAGSTAITQAGIRAQATQVRN